MVDVTNIEKWVKKTGDDYKDYVKTIDAPNDPAQPGDYPSYLTFDVKGAETKFSSTSWTIWDVKFSVTW